jgi:glycosyltransferase involved in cell wall biosynthesis
MGTPRQESRSQLQEQWAINRACAGAEVIVAWSVDGLYQRLKLLKQKNPSLKVVLVAHVDFPPGEHEDPAAMENFYGDFGHYATHRAAVTAQSIRAFPPDLRDSVTVIYNGVEVERCTPICARDEIRAAWGVGNSLVVGFLGRYAPEKRPWAAAQAVHQLRFKDGTHAAVAAYMGQGWYEDQLRNQVAELCREHVVWVPSKSQVGDFLSAIDVLVIGSDSHDVFSLVTVEAWLNETPVVSTPVGISRELEKDYGQLTARVSHDFTPEDIGNAVKLTQSEEWRATHLETARRVAWQRFTAPAMAERWTRYWEQITGRVPTGNTMPG